VLWLELLIRGISARPAGGWFTSTAKKKLVKGPKNAELVFSDFMAVFLVAKDKARYQGRIRLAVFGEARVQSHAAIDRYRPCRRTNH
jgi:hypothetical protein